jgi:hypothetical protein
MGRLAARSLAGSGIAGALLVLGLCSVFVHSPVAAWRIEPAPLPLGVSYGWLNGVSCTAPTACTAVGYFWRDRAGTASSTLAVRWDGRRWSVESTPTPNTPEPIGESGARLFDVSCTSSTFCMAVGDDSEENSVGLTELWNGERWSIRAVASPPGAVGGSLSDISCTSSTACTAVGVWAGDVSSGDRFVLPLVERWNGASCAIQSAPGLDGLRARSPAFRAR